MKSFSGLRETGSGLLPARPVVVEIHDGEHRSALTNDSRVRLRRVAVVSPCYNRPADARALLADLGRIDTHGIDLRIVLVDNASDEPIRTIPIPEGMRVEHLRLASNVGGAGGYNAGMALALGLSGEDVLNDPASPGRQAAALWGGGGALDAARAADFAAWDAEYLWLVDSDARVAPDTLAKLIEVLEARPDVIAAGASIVNPETGCVFEMGGRVNRVSGRLEPAAAGSVGMPETIECDYLAACCALVRTNAVRTAMKRSGVGAGLFPERFLNGDDAEWFIRLTNAAGGMCVAVRDAVAMHPTFDRYPTWQRYYMSRNAFGPIDALGLGGKVKFKRAFREVARAAQQQMVGRGDLARLHLLGLDHAARGKDTGPAPFDVLKVVPAIPVSSLAGTLDTMLPRLGRTRARVRMAHALGVTTAQRSAIIDALRQARLERIIEEPTPAETPRYTKANTIARLLVGPPARVAVVPARGMPDTWLLGSVTVQALPGTAGVVVKKTRRFRSAIAAGLTVVRGTISAAQVARRTAPVSRGVGGALRRAIQAQTDRTQSNRLKVLAPAHRSGDRCHQIPTLDVVVLTRTRFDALSRTLDNLIDQHGIAPASIIVVDNASADGTPAKLTTQYPGVRLLRQADNLGVEGFNRGVSGSSAEVVLILDDDACPAPGSIDAALAELAQRPELAAVTLHPRHASTQTSEWPFATQPDSAWPVMGCANFVRRADYMRVGGYESAFFLYRNDTDLALKLLGVGRGVGFNPAWHVDHDSAAAAPGAKKSHRWLHLATRNWVWVCRRHGRGRMRLLGILTGWLWAHKHAGVRPMGHLRALRGLVDGLVTSPPRVKSIGSTGEGGGGGAFARLMRMRMGGKRG